MKKEDIIKRANKDLAQAKKQGITANSYTDRDAYPTSPTPKKRPRNVSKKAK